MYTLVAWGYANWKSRFRGHRTHFRGGDVCSLGGNLKIKLLNARCERLLTRAAQNEEVVSPDWQGYFKTDRLIGEVAAVAEDSAIQVPRTHPCSVGRNRL